MTSCLDVSKVDMAQIYHIKGCLNNVLELEIDSQSTPKEGIRCGWKLLKVHPPNLTIYLLQSLFDLT